MGAGDSVRTHPSDNDSEACLIADHDGRKGKESLLLSVDGGQVEAFCSKVGIGIDEFFASAFGYATSRFTGCSESRFGIAGARGIAACTICCGDRSVADFLRESSDVIHSCIANDDGSGMNMLFSFGGASLPECDVGFSVSEKYVAEMCHSDKISPFVAERFVRVFDRLVSGLITVKSLSDIRYTPESDIAAAERMNENSHELRHNDILEAFSEKVGEQPDVTLVRYLDRTYTYGEADAISDSIAKRLTDSGICRGDRVSVFVSRGEMYLLSALGVLKAGCVYVPIDENHPDDRVEFMVTDSSSSVILTDQSMRERAESISSSTNVPVMVVSPSDGTNRPVARAKVSHGDGCVILYTSGTTGRPKGSFITHLALINLCEWYVDNTGMSHDDVMGMYTSFSFDMHAMAIFPPIVAGSSVDIIPKDVRLDMRQLSDYITDHGITHCFMTTHVGKMYITSGYRNLGVLYLAGEKLGEFRAPEGIRVYDGYGPSENLALTTSVLVNEKGDPSSVGVLNHNMKAYILDAEKRRVPFGAIGELFISGYQLSSGYLNREDANAKSFFANPFSEEKGYERMYASGDFFRYLPDGTFGFVGRRDGQVKIRGNRVELTEVESAIRDMEGITDVTVQAIVNSFGAKELCAYIVSGGKVSEKEVKDHIATIKPAYMVPYSVIELERIPLNTNGKVDRKALPHPFECDDKKGEMPRNALEKSICEVFATVLGRSVVYADDDFFALGGTSISAIKVIQECLRRKINLTYGILFGNPTPRMLAEYRPEAAVRRQWVPPGFLSKNRVGNICGKAECGGLGKVLLAGANGFFGSHVLRELLDQGAEKVYCMVKHGKESSVERFQRTMAHYFPEGIPESYLGRIEVIDGNINDPELPRTVEGYDIDMVFNCAAVVKYFAVGDIISKVNVDGSVILAGIAEKKHARYIHVSTMSTIGSRTSITPDIPYGEDMLDYGQGIPNMYISSKFEAEKRIMAMMEGGLDAKIMRLGNLMPRWSDGKFQPNIEDNGYIGMMTTVARFGYATEDSNIPTDLTPVDCAAKAAVLLSRVGPEYTVFHLYNSNLLKTGDILGSMNSRGAGIALVGRDEFERRFGETLETDPDALSRIIPFISESDKSERGVECYRCDFTLGILRDLGFEWPRIGKDYLDRLTDTVIAGIR